MREVRCVAYQVIVVLGLPEFARPHELPIGIPASEPFPTLQDRRQSIFAERLHDRVDVVGHHAPGVQRIALVFKMPQRIGNERSNRRLPQPARAGAVVEKAFDPL